MALTLIIINMLVSYQYEFDSCLEAIIDDPTAVDVEYYFYRMEQLTNALREFVSKEQAAHKDDEYEYR